MFKKMISKHKINLFFILYKKNIYFYLQIYVTCQCLHLTSVLHLCVFSLSPGDDMERAVWISPGPLYAKSVKKETSPHTSLDGFGWLWLWTGGWRGRIWRDKVGESNRDREKQTKGENRQIHKTKPDKDHDIMILFRKFGQKIDVLFRNS